MDKQKLVFEIIKTKLRDNQRISVVIGELLGIGADSAYRRIRGETELTFSELVKICDKFQISLNEILDFTSNKGVLFHYYPIDLLGEHNDYVNQLHQILNLFKAFKPIHNNEITYVARSIPLYYLLQCPELAFLNLYTWNKAFNPSYSHSFEFFCHHLNKEKILSLYKRIYQAFMLIPTKEIWNIQTINVTLRLLEYFFESGIFENKDTVLQLLEQLATLMDTVNQYANIGLKNDTTKTPFLMYSCPVDLDSNTILLKKEEQLTYFIRLNTMNFIETTNKHLCNIAQKLNADLVSKSILISGESSASKRLRFFTNAKNKIEESVRKIKSN